MASPNIHNTAAVTVWYHPGEKEAEAVQLYREQVAFTVVVDNSDEDNRALLKGMEKVIYLPLHSNQGIAAALNRGAEYCLEQGVEWVLTMDQDSRWDQQSVTDYMQAAARYEEQDKVAIFSPFQDCDGHPEKHHRKGEYEQREMVMCSGNLLRLKAWQEAKGFREDFFIDIVDEEICCHLRQLGWQVVRINSILLTHHLGNGVRHTGLTKHAYTVHPAWRYYYIARNIRRMLQLYPAMRPYYKHQVYKYLKRLFLYDFDHKIDKLKAFYKGWRADR